MNPLRTLSPAHRLWLVVGLVCALLWQPAGATARAAGMASGIEVCTMAGMQVVDADGLPLDAGVHPCTDCCGSLLPPGLLPSRSATAASALRHAAPASPPTVQRLAAEWLAPLSRGPPAHA